MPLQPGDLVVVCSDGVTEARNVAGDEFGRERLVEALHGRHGSKPEVGARAACSRRCKQFSQGAAQADDITLLVLRYTAAESVELGDFIRRTNAD